MRRPSMARRLRLVRKSIDKNSARSEDTNMLYTTNALNLNVSALL